MSASSQYYKVTAYAGVPHQHEVEVTLPTVGPQGPAGAAGASAWSDITGKPATFPPSAHTHGNITNDGLVGSTSGLPLKTGAGGIVEAGAFGTAAGQFAEGNHTHAASAITSGVFDNARINWAAPSAIGGTTAAAGTFTTLTANTSLTLNGTGAAELINAGAAAGPLRIYNTFTSATNHERGFLRWSSNAFQIGTEKGTGSPGGTARALEFQTDGVTRMTIAANANTLTLPNGSTIDSVSAFGGLTIGSNAAIIRVSAVLIGSNEISLRSSDYLGYTESTAFSTAPTIHTALRREATGVLAQRTGNQPTGQPQTYRLYGDWSSSGTNFERLAISAQASANFFLDTQKGGTGSARALEFRTDGTARLTIGSAGTVTLNTTLAADAQNISTDTTTGTKIGTGTTQKIGFFNATPVVQQAAVADATDAASTQARLNDLLARLRTLGLIAT